MYGPNEIHSPELRVKTVKYFKSIERVQDDVEKHHSELRAKGVGVVGGLGVGGLIGHGSWMGPGDNH